MERPYLFHLPGFGYPEDVEYFKSILENRLRYWDELPREVFGYDDRLENAIREALRIYEVTVGEPYCATNVRPVEVEKGSQHNQGNRLAYISLLSALTALISAIIGFMYIIN